MARNARHDPFRDVDEPDGERSVPAVAEFRSEAPPRGTRPVDAAMLDKVGFAAHAERAAQATTPEPREHSVGAGQVLTASVSKFDARTGGMPLSFPEGTPVGDLPEWLANDVVNTPGLTREG